MATALETTQGAVTGSTEGSSAFLQYLGANWPRLVILVLVAAFLIYTVIYMRKRFAIVREFLVFLQERKLWWMTPIIVVFALLAVLVVTMENSVISFFFYTIW